jgi:16S rRNA (uracil1498-N3)-methyltransferase
VRVGALRPRQVESPLPITLAQGISRGERMDITLQKAVELGAARIAPLVTSYCQVRLEGERLERRHRHWLGIIVAACEQCGRTRLPELLPAMTLAEWLAAETAADELRIVLDHQAERSFAQIEAAPRALTLLVGPEGGLEDTEIEAAQRAGYQGLRLGPRVLRTETAGLVALTAMQLRWGDLS